MNQLTIPMTPVWANNTSGSALDHPLTDALDATTLHSVRVSLEMAQRTGNLYAQVYIETSDDALTWTGATTIGSAVSADGVTYGTSWIDVSAIATGRFARLGIRAWNDTGTALNLANISLRVELRGA